MARDVESLLAQPRWHEERKAMRALLLRHGLTERVKWNKLCYEYDGSTVAILYGFKNDCAIGFFKGSLLDDPDSVLQSPGEHSRAMRRIHFTGVDEIVAKEALVDRYVTAAIALEQQGLRVDFEDREPLAVPDELRSALDEDAELARAFDDLTPGRQRGYVLHFSGAKQSSTRATRIQRSRARILEGKGLDDR